MSIYKSTKKSDGQATRKRRVSTRTSSFGVTGRIAHDSSPFYKGRLYQNLSIKSEAIFKENTIDPNYLDHIFGTSSESMSELPNDSIHLVVTSPPYNVGKDYDKNLSLDNYLLLIKRVLQETHRVLVPGGRAAINIANLGRKPYIPLHAFLIKVALEIGFLMRGEIIWDKAASASASTAWGSWKSPTNPTLRDTHEYILVFCKDTFSRKPATDREITISRDQFLEYTKSVWTFPAESARKIGHPAPFPIELPSRLIHLYTYQGEIILDPFAGSGTTCLAAIKAGRHYVAYETEPNYIKLAKSRLVHLEAKPNKAKNTSIE